MIFTTSSSGNPSEGPGLLVSEGLLVRQQLEDQVRHVGGPQALKVPNASPT